MWSEKMKDLGISIGVSYAVGLVAGFLWWILTIILPFDFSFGDIFYSRITIIITAITLIILATTDEGYKSDYRAICKIFKNFNEEKKESKIKFIKSEITNIPYRCLAHFASVIVLFFLASISSGESLDLNRDFVAPPKQPNSAYPYNFGSKEVTYFTKKIGLFDNITFNSAEKYGGLTWLDFDGLSFTDVNLFKKRPWVSFPADGQCADMQGWIKRPVDNILFPMIYRGSGTRGWTFKYFNDQFAEINSEKLREKKTKFILTLGYPGNTLEYAVMLFKYKNNFYRVGLKHAKSLKMMVNMKDRKFDIDSANEDKYKTVLSEIRKMKTPASRIKQIQDNYKKNIRGKEYVLIMPVFSCLNKTKK